MCDGAFLAPWQRLCQEANYGAWELVQGAARENFRPEENGYLGAELSELLENGLNLGAVAIFKEARLTPNCGRRLRLKRAGLKEGRLTNKGDAQRRLGGAPDLVYR